MRDGARQRGKAGAGRRGGATEAPQGDRNGSQVQEEDRVAERRGVCAAARGGAVRGADVLQSQDLDQYLQ